VYVAKGQAYPASMSNVRIAEDLVLFLLEQQRVNIAQALVSSKLMYHVTSVEVSVIYHRGESVKM